MYIDWERYPIYEDVSVTRCFNCQGFYHKSATCNKGKVCKNCAGEHDSSDCGIQTRRCVNCLMANDRYKTEYNTSHAASDPNCPSTKYHMDVLRSKTNYNL